MSLDYKSNHPNLRASGYLWEPADSGDSGDSGDSYVSLRNGWLKRHAFHG